MISAYVEGIGLWASGLAGWTNSRPVLRGETPYEPAPMTLPTIELLPPNERRRMVATVKLAVVTGLEGFAMAGRDPADTATVFTSSGGDGETLHNIISSLATSPLEVSPTRFHNSVHNAPAGYWGIATKARAPSTALCAHDWSFSAGLLDAVAQAVSDGCPVGLIAFDVPYPEPLHSRRPLRAALGTALILSPTRTAKSVAVLGLSLERKRPATSAMDDRRLEDLRRGTPAARALPLLAALARECDASIVLEHAGGGMLTVTAAPVLQ
jgi:hypothetical protein